MGYGLNARKIFKKSVIDQPAKRLLTSDVVENKRKQLDKKMIF